MPPVTVRRLCKFLMLFWRVFALQQRRHRCSHKVQRARAALLVPACEAGAALLAVAGEQLTLQAVCCCVPCMVVYSGAGRRVQVV